MAKKIKPFVVTNDNMDAYEAIYAGKDQNVLVAGPRRSGKSTLANQFINDSTMDRTNDLAMLCSGAELFMATFVEENIRLLERAGQVPTVVVDDIELLLKEKEGPKLLSLLVESRTKSKFRTILVSNMTQEEVCDRFPEIDFDSFKKCDVSLLSGTNLRPYCREMYGFYRVENSPLFDDSAYDAMIAFIEEGNRDIASLDALIQYLCTHCEDYAGQVLTGQQVVSMITGQESRKD